MDCLRPWSKSLIELNPEARAPPPRSVGTHSGSAAWMTERSVLLWVILSQRFKNSQFGFVSKASFSSFPVLENCTGFGVCSKSLCGAVGRAANGPGTLGICSGMGHLLCI